MDGFWRKFGAASVPLLLALSAWGQSDLTVEVDQLGVGGHFRPGGLTALRLKLTSALAEPTPVWVQWQVPNADGDITENGRSLTLTPSQPAFAWLYAELPHNVTPSTIWTVRIFEERDGVRRRELGGARIGPASAVRMVEPAAGMMAIVGDRRLGLDDYSNTRGTQTGRPIGAHEDTSIAFGIKPTELPDRWYGLRPFEALAWAGDNVPPQDLGVDQAAAVREYVRQGGHLIISLPAAGNQWGLGAIGQTQLEDLLPCRTPGKAPRKDDAVPLADFLPAISKFSDVKTLLGVRKQPEFSIRIFKDLRGTFDVIDNHFEPLLALPDGRVIAVQRWFGSGRITVIGIDLADGRLAGLGLPQADAFWNRILGRRVDTPTATELSETEKAQRLDRRLGNRENALGSGHTFTSGTFGINMSGEAAKGLLLAFVLFVVYWLVAGPGGFAVLKQYGQVRHAWLAFAACAALFTAIAWGSVGLIPKRMQIKHITILDHIARPPDDPRPEEPQYQRALSFFSLYLPGYGTTPMAIASTPDQRDVLTSWTPPPEQPQYFPNVDRYQIDVARSPAAYSLPSRSTATQLCAHWMGGLDPQWGGLLRVDPNNPLRVDVDAGGGESLRGAIINELPGTLANVTVIWVKNNRFTRRTYEKDANGVERPWVPMSLSGLGLNSGGMWAQAAWEQGKALDLTATTSKPTELWSNITLRYINHFAGGDLPGTSPVFREGDRSKYIEMLSFFHQLNPPNYLKSAGDSIEESVVFHRHVARELDLSAWFTRPCVIIIGYLEGSDCPVPVRVDGDDQPPPTNPDSLTVVRWIYPLPLEEKVAFKEVFQEE